VIVAGGGPAGSTCAWALRQEGLDVVVMDRATFPRDKVCAGWIPPQVLADLQLDVQDYRRVRTFQPFTAFRIGMIGDKRRTDIDYGHPVSYGIRRCEFDSYLLADRLERYERSLRDRFGVGVGNSAATGRSTNGLLARWLLRAPWFVRHVLLDRWFLHADDAPLAPGPGWKPPVPSWTIRTD